MPAQVAASSATFRVMAITYDAVRRSSSPASLTSRNRGEKSLPRELVFGPGGSNDGLCHQASSQSGGKA